MGRDCSLPEAYGYTHGFRTQFTEVSTNMIMPNVWNTSIQDNWSSQNQDITLVNTESNNAENMTTNLADYCQENNTLCQPSFSSVLRPIGGCFNATVPVQNQEQAKNLEKNSVAREGMYSYTQLSDLKPKGQFSIIGIVHLLHAQGHRRERESSMPKSN
ncbi:hypothetical protein ABKN59_001447 [Abortiporus biennis]